MNTIRKTKYWVLRRGEAYFNTWNTDFFNRDIPSKENDFNSAFRFLTLEKLHGFIKAHSKRNISSDIIEVSESVSINYKFKKVSK